MDYKNGRIYKIISDETDKIYIGSTTQPLSKRLSVHKSNYKQYLLGRSSRLTSFDLIALGPVQIVLVELYPCKTKEELEKQECYYIKLYKNIVVNKVHPTRTQKEYYNDKKDEFKKYYLNNKKKRVKYQKQYDLNNKDKLQTLNKCECGGQYTTHNRSYHLLTGKHQNYLNKDKIKIKLYSFNTIFECDSKLLRPRTYPNYVIIN
jgi:hypothetical protein